MIYRAILLLFLFLPTPLFAQTTSIFTLNRGPEDIINKFVDVPDIVSKLDLKIAITAFPKHHYYKAQVELRQPEKRICSFIKTLEVWELPNQKPIVRSTVDVNLNIRIKLLKKIIEPRVEKVILSGEKRFLESRLQ